MKASELTTHIIRPALARLGAYDATEATAHYATEAAAQLLLATAAQESRCGYWLRQVNGPALGIYQMEPATLHDLHVNYLAYRPSEAGLLGPECPERLVYDLQYATWIARLNYYRVPQALPAVDDISGMWAYYKQYWNTHAGAATEDQFVSAWRTYVVDNPVTA